jgi:hypothetical protein
MLRYRTTSNIAHLPTAINKGIASHTHNINSYHRLLLQDCTYLQVILTTSGDGRKVDHSLQKHNHKN